jgi:hypothetical protein
MEELPHPIMVEMEAHTHPQLAIKVLVQRRDLLQWPELVSWEEAVEEERLLPLK